VIPPRSLAVALVALIAAGLAGCTSGVSEFMREPKLSPVGSGLATKDDTDSGALASTVDPRRPTRPGAPINLYTEQRIAKVGDIVTVVISINDKATFDNATDRTKNATSTFNLDWGLTSGTASSQNSTLTAGANSVSTLQGQGNIDRQEQIQVSVAAIVTNVLPNGNLVISGSQEVRVNYELRQLTVAGIVRPSDISRANTISYDRIAEARISYGGRGRLTEVQQPSWGQQLSDWLKPF
jgi:flagellar L-ring protein precursor FlgH